MVKWSCIDLKAGEAGDNVAVLISMVDRGRGDPRNILGVIVDWDEHNMYRIAVKAEILSIKYFRNQFDLCLQQLLNDSDVNTDVPAHFVKLASLQLLANKRSFGVTAAKARINVRQTSASVINQRGFVTASVRPVLVVKIRISRITVSLKISHCGDFVWKCVIKNCVQILKLILGCFTLLFYHCNHLWIKFLTTLKQWCIFYKYITFSDFAK